MKFLKKYTGKMNNNKNEPSEHWKVFALFFQEAMKDKEMNSSQLAEKIGVHRSTLKRFFDLDFPLKFDVILKIVHALELNLFFESRNSETDLNQLFEKAMTELGRRPDKLPKN
tara:strand:+ start:608 stop:946 length:339 start_codon:yes stop_codon:yes gene_type:complete